MCGTMPKHNKSRRSGEGKSRPDTPPPQRGSRSKVIWRGHPDFCKKVITASKAGGFVEIFSSLGREGKRSACIDPRCRLRPPAGACLVNSVQVSPSLHPSASIWISSNGSRSSLEWGGSLERGTRQPLACKIFQMVRLERGSGTCAAWNSGSRGRE
jgi:hypothetical protein